jgi:hypothetical protein
MKRSRPAHLLPVLVLVALLNASFILPARANCGADIQAVQAQLPAVKDQNRRQELQKLVEKAQKDNETGRANLCVQAVKRARILLK